MMLRDEDSGTFKGWLLPKLVAISDAEAGVLADYVIALVTANEPEENIRRNCLESLPDFLLPESDTASFVDEIVDALRTKSYVPRGPTNSSSNPESGKTQSLRSTNTPAFQAPNGPAATRAPPAQPRQHDQSTGPSPAQSNSLGANTEQSSRKRKQAQWDMSETREGQHLHNKRSGAAHRPTKQTARRGGRGLRGAAAAFQPQTSFPSFVAPMSNMLNMADLPPPPPGPLPFDVNNPMTFFAMMAALGTNLPGMPPLPPINTLGSRSNGPAPKAKCYDYHTKGFCALGTLCSFEHGDTISASSDVLEYDPNQPLLEAQLTSAANQRHVVSRGHNGGNKGRFRALSSLSGMSYDRTNTTLVIEHIPEENFSEDHVRGFFSQFGTIAHVQMQAHKRLAIVKFDDHAAADQAYKSPKAVFENRFVKVYWHRQDIGVGSVNRIIGDVEMAHGDGDYGFEQEALDLEAIEKRQAEAQKAFEERRKRKEEADAKAADVDRQLRETEAEMRKVKQQLVELAGDDLGSLDGLDLATLQAEAECLFEQNDTTSSAGRGRGFPSRGATRGRGFVPFSSCGRSAPRGTHWGRGAFTTSHRSSVKRLDNRPRRIAVAGIEKGTKKDEALRQYLVNIPECTSIERHFEEVDTLILTFQERFQAEMFLDNSYKIPDTGPLELSWVPNDAFGGIDSIAATNVDDADVETSDGESSATVAEEKADETEENIQATDADMDVADDVDQWL